MRIKHNIDWALRRINALWDESRLVDNIFDYNQVIRKRPDLDRDVYGSNGFYGGSYVLKHYSGYKRKVCGLIEHAPGLTNIALGEYKSDISNNLFVCSKQRKKFLLDKTKQNIFDIGPIIAYADGVYTKAAVDNIRGTLGKTLLVYPVHNFFDSNWKSDVESFIEYVKEIVRDFKYDTVLVSMYHIDIKNGAHFRYMKEGWHIVSAGETYNYDFNDCMKTIISLADCAVFQAYSSAVGYCIYMGVPVNICNEQKFMVHSMWRKNYADDILDEFTRVFGEYTESITSKQRSFASYYFGFDSVKSPQQLNKLLVLAHKLHKGK